MCYSETVFNLQYERSFVSFVLMVVATSILKTPVEDICCFVLLVLIGLKIELDETQYDFGTCYEIECESDDPEKVKKVLEYFFKDWCVFLEELEHVVWVMLLIF